MPGDQASTNGNGRKDDEDRGEGTGGGLAFRENERTNGGGEDGDHLGRALDPAQVGAAKGMAPNGKVDDVDEASRDAKDGGKQPKLRSRMEQGQHAQTGGIEKEGSGEEARQGPAEGEPAAKELAGEGADLGNAEELVISLRIEAALGEDGLVEKSEPGKDEEKEPGAHGENPENGSAHGLAEGHAPSRTDVADGHSARRLSEAEGYDDNDDEQTRPTTIKSDTANPNEGPTSRRRESRRRGRH